LAVVCEYLMVAVLTGLTRMQDDFAGETPSSHCWYDLPWRGLNGTKSARLTMHNRGIWCDIRPSSCHGSFAKANPTDPVDVIISDDMSEANMVVAAARKVDSALPTTPDGNSLTAAGPAFEARFLEALEPALDDLAKHKIKVAVNAGTSDTKGLYKVVIDRIEKEGLSSQLKVAWISGVEVLPAITSGLKAGTSTFKNIYTGEILDSWSCEPI
jgi:hypothetical protein